MSNTMIDPLMLSDRQAARLCGISRSQLHNLRASGKFPQPVKLGRCTRWNRRELEAWLAAGAPPLARWEAVKGHGK